MKKLILFCLLATPLLAQERVVPIQNWRVHTGDDQSWAQPDFDDSKWTVSPFPQRYTTAQAFFAGFRWYRATLSLPPDLAGGALAIGIGPLDEVFDIFVNGIRVGTSGNWRPAPAGYFPRTLSFAIPPEALRGQDVMHLAIRRWTGASRTNVTSLVASGSIRRIQPPEIGPPELVRTTEQLRTAANLIAYTPNILASLGLMAAGLLSLALFFAETKSRVNLWLGVALLCEGLPYLAGIPVELGRGPLRSPIATLVVGLDIGRYALWSFFLANICTRLGMPLRIASGAQFLVAVSIAIGFNTQFADPFPLFGQASFWIGVIAPLAVAIVLIAERRDSHSVLLAVALCLPPAGQVWLTQIALWFGLTDEQRFIHAGPFIIDPRNMARLVFAVVALSVLYARHLREQERKSAVDQDLAAARLVQESLLAGRRAETRSFDVHAVYLPAGEVGGDFFHELPGDDGSIAVLIGDVSGKGLRAALLVGHISGALSNELSREPGEILANLNKSLIGRLNGGFVTCCCARFDVDGSVAVANGGHPTPYAGGRELAVVTGLPLGLIDDAEYPETRFVLGKDELFALVSDGVVEAADTKGELFGFDRTGEISGQSAHEIADAAKAWGQNDDITVVTVRRAG